MAEIKSVCREFWSFRSSKDRKTWLKKIRAAIEQMDLELWRIQKYLMPDDESPPEQLFDTELKDMFSELALRTVMDEFKICVERMKLLQPAFGVDDAEDDSDEMDTSEETEKQTNHALTPPTSSSPNDFCEQLERLKLQCDGADQRVMERDDSLLRCTQIIQRLEDEVGRLQKELAFRNRDLQQVIQERDVLKAKSEPQW